MDTTVIRNELITVEVLLDGGSSQIVVLPDYYRFSSATARDAYFAANPDELVTRLWVLVDNVLYQYLNNIWTSMSSVITGPAGANGKPFNIVDRLESTDDLPEILESNTNEAYLITDFIDGEHLFVSVGMVWQDCGAFSGVPGPKGDTGPQGEPGEAPMLSVNDEGHLIATYEGDYEWATK